MGCVRVSVSRTPQEKLGRADSQAGAWLTRAYIPGSRYNLRSAGTSHGGGAFRRRRTPGRCRRSGRSLPSLLSQPGRTRHMRCFHRGPMNRGAHTGTWRVRRIRTPVRTRWTGTPATVHLGGLDTGASTAHVVDRHMQPSRRFTRKADDLPWSVSSHASSVVTRGRLASGSHGLRWRAREGSFGIPGPGWPGAVSSVADPAGRRTHLRVYGRPARAAPVTGVA